MSRAPVPRQGAPPGTVRSRAAAAEIPSELRRNFAVLIPAYNEVENIPALFQAIAATFDAHGLEGEVILVDDGSTDGTWEAAHREAYRLRRLKVLRHRRNHGKTEAMVTGAEAAESDYLILFDADLQHSPEVFPDFLRKLSDG